MHEHLKGIPVEQRPKMISLFPGGLPYFRAWQSLQWYLALLLPIIGSAISLYLHKHGIGVAMTVGLTGAFVAASLFVDLCSGMASSNWGTHFREGEPRLYWLHVAVVAMVYLALLSVGYFV